MFVGVAISLIGTGIGVLALGLDHAEADRRRLSIVGVVGGLLVPILAVLTLRWVWVFVALAHVSDI